MLLHYFFLSTFAWMLVEGLHLYSMVIKVFGSEDSKHLYYYGIGWGRWGWGGAGQAGCRGMRLSLHIVLLHTLKKPRQENRVGLSKAKV